MPLLASLLLATPSSATWYDISWFSELAVQIPGDPGLVGPGTMSGTIGTYDLAPGLNVLPIPASATTAGFSIFPNQAWNLDLFGTSPFDLGILELRADFDPMAAQPVAIGLETIDAPSDGSNARALAQTFPAECGPKPPLPDGHYCVVGIGDVTNFPGAEGVDFAVAEFNVPDGAGGITTISQSSAAITWVVELSPDTDGDGVQDPADECQGYDDGVDTDNDGVADGCDACPLDDQNDADGDGVCGDVDLCLGDDASGDTDADGLCDDGDPCVGASNTDSDGDGICDEGDLCVGDDATGNSDGDGVCNDLDQCLGDDASGDDDGDLTCNDIDVCPLDSLNDGDGDGLCEVDDNCDEIPNSDQLDNDLDGAGDVCDPDDDNDGVNDPDDNCPLDANADQADDDNDGIGNVCDPFTETDEDSDGVDDVADVCPGTQEGATVDPRGCSIGQLCPCENEWKNHGAFVKCTAQTGEDFVAAGLISEAEKDAIVSEAGGSSCGKKQP